MSMHKEHWYISIKTFQILFFKEKKDLNTRKRTSKRLWVVPYKGLLESKSKSVFS